MRRINAVRPIALSYVAMKQRLPGSYNYAGVVGGAVTLSRFISTGSGSRGMVSSSQASLYSVSVILMGT